jgi:hypothetical protein
VILRPLVTSALIALLTGCGGGRSDDTGVRLSGEPIEPLVTPNTVRLTGPTPFEAAAAVTQITYGGAQHEDRPHAVALIRVDRQADAMLAASRITHFPVNCPVLYVEADKIPLATMEELRRLRPDGTTYDNKVQVFLVGPINPAVGDRLRRDGYKVRAFPDSNPIDLAETLDTWAAAVHADHPDEVAIVQLDQLATGLPAVAWNAHMGHGLLFVQGDSVPPPTRRALSRRFGREAFIYLFGDSSIISPKVAAALAPYGHVQRIPGATPTAISIAFAGFRDAGFNQGFWVRSSTRDFGWGIAEAGHNVTIVSATEWQLAVTGSLLSHLGKHGPMLVLPPAGRDSSVLRYLAQVRPSESAPVDQLINHAWILGDTAHISADAQAEIDIALNPAATHPATQSGGK